MKNGPAYEELLAENRAMKTEVEAMKAEVSAMKANEISLKARIAYLQRLLYGTKSDRLASKVPSNQRRALKKSHTEAYV